MLAGTARAQESAGAPMPLQVHLRQEPAPFTDPRYTAFVTLVNLVNDKFAFHVPQGFFIRGDPGSGTLTLGNREGNCSITFAVLDVQSSDPSTLSADDYRDSVLKDYPTATIIQQYTRSAPGGSGPVFDLQWKVSGSLFECKRVMFISSPAGVLKYTATTTRANFDSLKGSLESMVMSMQSSTDGVLKIPLLPTTS
jgi:hypothetical protein